MARVGRPMTIEHARARTNVSGVYRTRSRSRRMSRRPSNKSSPKGTDSISGNQSISQSGIAGRTALSDIRSSKLRATGRMKAKPWNRSPMYSPRPGRRMPRRTAG